MRLPALNIGNEAMALRLVRTAQMIGALKGGAGRASVFAVALSSHRPGGMEMALPQMPFGPLLPPEQQWG